MKVLLAHTFYRSSAPSGEDSVYLNERSLLDEHYDVVRYEKHNDDLDDSTLQKQVGLAISGAWSRKAYDEVSELIRKTRPDVAHFHNTFPQITPSAWAACQANGVPVVQTLHNFRYICPAALLQRKGKPCEDCISGSLLNSLKHRCYRGSLAATGAQAWTIARNRLNGGFRKNVDRYLALTDFAAGRMIAGGLPAENVIIKPNFLPEIPAEGKGEGGYVVYTGRLSDEKGVHTLLKAWQQVNPAVSLKLVGDGPLRPELEQYVQAHQLNVEFMGFCDKQTVLKLVGGALFQVVPSEWYEGFPMVILEAYGCGTPVLASKIGSLDEVVEEGVTGRKFTPGDQNSLAGILAEWLSNPDQVLSLRGTTRQRFLDRYTSDANLTRTAEIYEQVQR